MKRQKQITSYVWGRKLVIQKSGSMSWVGLTSIVLLTFSCGFRSQVKKEVPEAEETRRWVPVITKTSVTLRPIGPDLKVMETEHPALRQARQHAEDFLEIDCSRNGGMAFDTHDWDFESYMVALKKRIESQIHPPKKFSEQGAIEGKSLLHLKILSGGQLAELHLVSYEGHSTLAETSLLGVEFAAPFEALPADLLKNRITLP